MYHFVLVLGRWRRSREKREMEETEAKKGKRGGGRRDRRGMKVGRGQWLINAANGTVDI